ncbi:hypothetical protein HRG_012497 [Hirsutella rhossiliensis]
MPRLAARQNLPFHDLCSTICSQQEPTTGTSLITTKEPKHLFYCRKIAPRHRMRLAPSPSAAVNRAIGRDFDQFVKVAKASSFFGTICPRH